MDLPGVLSGQPSASDEDEAHRAEPLELWSPRAVGWASALLGFPGGTVLAALNWRQMGQTGKAIGHLAAAVIATWALFFVDQRIGVPLGFAVAYYLYRVQRTDQSQFSAAVGVIARSGLVGAGIAIVATIVTIFSGAVVATTVGVGEVAHRGEVLFGTGAGTDICSPAGQTTVFGPTDTFFLSAVMRETVQTGSHVVLEIDGPGATSDTAPVTVEPPFDCLGSTAPVGPFDPGTYVVRYRYDGPPGTPDLASGTLTIRTGAGGSPTP